MPAIAARAAKALERNGPAVSFGIIVLRAADCLNCHAPGISALLMNTKNSGHAALSMIVISGGRWRDVLAVKRKLVADTVIADSTREFTRIFPVETTPAFFLFDSSRMLRIHRDNAVDEPFSLDSIDTTFQRENERRSHTITVAAGMLGSELRLAESESAPLLHCTNTVYDKRDERIFVLDGAANHILIYSAITGALLDSITEPDVEYLRTAHDTHFWQSLNSISYPTLKLLSMTATPSADTIFVLGKVVVGGTASKPDSSGRTLTALVEKMMMFEYARGGTMKAVSIPESRYFPVALTFLRSNSLVETCVWNGYSRSVAAVHGGRDSLYFGQRMSVSLDSVQRFLPIEVLERNSVNSTVDPLLVGSLASVGRDSVVYLNHMNGVFLLAAFHDDSIAYTPIRAGGTLLKSMRCKFGVTPSESAKADPNCLFYVAGTISNGKRIHVVLKPGGNDDMETLILQEYDTHGEFLGERSFKRSGDSFRAASVVGYRKKELLVLVQWNNAGWRLESVPLLR